jgi:predicted outer membrane lipoprotein
MTNRKSIWIIGLVLALIFSILLAIAAEAKPDVYQGQVVSTDRKMIRVKRNDGRVSVFWLGRRTKFDSRAPLPGDRVRIEYVKDRLRRNAVTRITILNK